MEHSPLCDTSCDVSADVVLPSGSRASVAEQQRGRKGAGGGANIVSRENAAADRVTAWIDGATATPGKGEFEKHIE